MRLGILGLGRAARQVLRALKGVTGIKLTAVADTQREAFAIVRNLPEVKTFESAEALAACQDLDVIWIATPSALHCEHVMLLASGGKHIICEKPIALSLAECDRMIESAALAGVKLMLVSKSFDPPIRAMQAVVGSGRLGKLVSINCLVFTDWMQRPRLAEEFDTEKGGGVVFRQAPHLVDIVRFLSGGLTREVRASAGQFDLRFATEGNYSAFLTFAEGAVATLTFNGYGYFDSSELTAGFGEGGDWQDPETSGAIKNFSAAPVDVKGKSAYLASLDNVRVTKKGLPHYGQTIISCERGVIRQIPEGIRVYSANGVEDIKVAACERCTGELIEMRDAIARERRVFPDGEWGRATLEICIGILKSSETGQSIIPQWQTAPPH